MKESSLWEVFSGLLGGKAREKQIDFEIFIFINNALCDYFKLFSLLIIDG
ncbi:hypothetical protein ACLK19_27825 [Escherichia coli]